MELVYAALLLHSNKQPINEENLNKVLNAAGAKVDPTQVKALVAALDGVNIDEAIAKAVTMPTLSSAAKEEKKEEKKEEDIEKKAEEAAAGLAGLFG